MLLRSISVALVAALAMSGVSAQVATAESGPAYGPRLEGFDYPAPVHLFKFESQGNALEMAYLDIKPEQANGQVAVLLHGKNFCAATWDGTIQALTSAGYRVIAPDQIGFCKSSKPRAYQYSFQQLASNTHALLASLGIQQAILIGHSLYADVSDRSFAAGDDQPDWLGRLEGQGRAIHDGRPMVCT